MIYVPVVSVYTLCSNLQCAKTRDSVVVYQKESKYDKGFRLQGRLHGTDFEEEIY